MFRLLVLILHVSRHFSDFSDFLYIQIVELLETASATARRNTAREVAKRSTQISRWWLAYQSLVQVIQGHAKLFVESELQSKPFSASPNTCF
ncbi:hypothetical protein OE88DRAFT_1662272 [Heliocybe sulcata]|uniref:Uncharacterized protein n=1 Tax=Heliocybe sulcata TaxID=5364 RepID=A0A5C3MXC9_9AGAM|nr:hypothetical protein OE88DRAFT_1662272 [Heliocybe sulcata]